MKKINVERIKEFLLKRDNLIILILTGILFLVIAWPIEDNSQNTEKTTESSEMYGLWDRNNGNIDENKNELKQSPNGDIQVQALMPALYQENYIVNLLEQKLEDILSSIYGVGKVKVMITLTSGGEKVIAKDIPLERNNIVENDSTGGSRNTNEMYSQEETVYSTTAEGEKIPYVIRENSAVVRGVSVVAEGGDNPMVQKNISDVIMALFGIEEHKIKVVKMKQEE